MSITLRIYTVTLLLLWTPVSFAQNSINKNKKIYKQAEKHFEQQDFLKAFKLYAKIIASDSSSHLAYYKAGLCLFNMNNSDTSSMFYFVVAKQKIPEAIFYTGRIYHLRNKCEEALQEFHYFKTINKQFVISNKGVDQYIKKCETALKEAGQQENYLVKNMGPSINTKYPEYAPLIWDLNGSLLFTSRRPGSKGNLTDPYGKYFEDIYSSDKVDGKWQTPLPMSNNLNAETHNACVAFSSDGDEIIIYRTDDKQLLGDLYVSHYDSSNWSIPTKLGPEINSKHQEASACFSAYGNIILFSSDRPGGYGGKDLYRAIRFLNGKISLPANLGPSINTDQDEDTPFLDKNDNTLYFSSKGHGSMGEYDIFKAKYDLEKTIWTNVENMGQPLNSTQDDICFVKLRDRNFGYFASRREDGYGDTDLYEVNFDESSKEIIYCKINTNGLNDAELEGLQLSLYNSKTGKREGLYTPNKKYRTSILLVTKGASYQLKAEGKYIATTFKQILIDETAKELTMEVNKKN